MTTSPHQNSKRFDKKNWLLLGVEFLSNQPSQQLTIDELCKNASKTKGSFYFHFKNIDEYCENLTAYWLEEYTVRITQKPIQKTKRLDLLNLLAARLDLNLEVGIRNLAFNNETVQKIVQKADKSRVKWLSALYVNSGLYNQEQATALASIEIAAFTGFKLINPDMKPSEARDLYENFLKLTNRA